MSSITGSAFFIASANWRLMTAHTFGSLFATRLIPQISLSWYKYYQDGYAYAPIDDSGEKTLTWQYLRAVNHQLRVLGPMMNRLTSTGVFFTSPPPVTDLPLLPGSVVKEFESTASPRGLSNAKPPIMVGEFRDEQGRDYVMLVNLEKSTNIRLTTVQAYQTKHVVSAEDGRLLPWDDVNGHWLLAGHGLLIKLEEAVQVRIP